MRQIKFRAWVEPADIFRGSSTGQMFTGFTFDSIESGRDEANVYCDDGQTWEEPRWGSAKLMQYTGLKDKNGVEIYEGDIVRENGEFGEDDRYVVEYEFNGFWLKGRGDNEFDFGNPDNMEVIGNIWENPELLEAKS